MYQTPMHQHPSYQDPWGNHGVDQSLKRRSPSVPDAEREVASLSGLESSLQYGPTNQSMMRGQPSFESQDVRDRLMTPGGSSQGPYPRPAASNARGSQSQALNHSHNIYPSVQNRNPSQGPFLLSPMAHLDIGAGYPTPEDPLFVPSLPIRNPNGGGPAHSLNDSGQGNSSHLYHPVGNYSTPSVEYEEELFPLPTSSLGSSGDESSRTPGSLFEHNIRSYVDRDGPWNPLSADRMELQAGRDTQAPDSSYYPHGQWFPYIVGGTRPYPWLQEDGRLHCSLITQLML